MPFWHRLVVLGAVLLVTVVVARLVDRRMARRDLPATAVTRYRVLRRAIVALIFFVGILSALRVIPEVRAVATGILASSAIVGIVVGFAAQRTIGNFIAGLLIAFTQPIRIGDHVEIDGTEGVVEEIGLTYTFIRVTDNDRLVIPNDRIASDTILNSTIRGRKKLAHVTVQVPLDRDLTAVSQLLREAADDEGAEVRVTSLEDGARLELSVWADDEPPPARRGSEARRRPHGPPRGADHRAGDDRLRCRRRRQVPRELRPEQAEAGRERPELVCLRLRRLVARLHSCGQEPHAGRAARGQLLDAKVDRRDRGPPL